MNTYDVKILADSVSPDSIRLTTLQVTFPRFILAEVNTHRVLSRNSASSRAIPPEKQIARVREHCFVPETFNRRVKGMGGGAALDPMAQLESEKAWRESAEQACRSAERLIELDVDKARVNRLLEPFLWHTAIITATEWSNFFALRDHPDAQPEFQIIARMMREAMDASEPQPIGHGWWHLPLVTEEELADLCHHRDIARQPRETPEIQAEFEAVLQLLVESDKKVSAGRCARVSFDTQDQQEYPHQSITRAERLMTSGHFSPFEHQARPLEPNDFAYVRPTVDVASGFVNTDSFVGNFRGWVQFRKEIPGENDFSQIREKETVDG